jgi:hypothetical protein
MKTIKNQVFATGTEPGFHHEGGEEDHHFFFREEDRNGT